jgi:beta-lactamase regulating signal transducer with metallopeptidase domain
MILLLKVTMLLAAGWAIAGLLARKSAAVRHLAWALTLTGALALAITTPLASILPLRVAAWQGVTIRALEPRLESTVREAAPVPTVAPVSAVPDPVDLTDPTVPTVPTDLTVLTVLAIIWLVGGAVVTAWYGLGHARLSRLARRATPITGPDWQAALHEIAARNQVAAPVRLLRSAAVGSPLTWGTFRPVVLLPADAESWPLDRRRVVLAHELAHAARGDYLTQLVACAACAVYWFHPLVWVAARRLRLESERACDDQVLARGVSGVDYAAHLLDVARLSRGLRLGGGVAIGMARPSHLEGRLLAVLDPERPRRSPPPRTRWAAWTGLAAFVLPLGLITPVAMRSPEHPLDAHPDLVSEPVPRTVVESDAVRFRITEDSTFERSVRASPGEQLELDLETGASVEVRGWDQHTVRVRGRLGGNDWSGTEVTLERTDGGVRLHAWQAGRRRSYSTSHAFEIMVPRRFDIHISSGGGGLILADVEGSFDGETGGGGLRIERAQGTARLSTGGGDIKVTESTLEGVVSTGGGTVVLSQVRGGLRGESGSGPVVRADGGYGGAAIAVDGAKIVAAGGLHVSKAGGAITLDAAPMGAEVSTGGGDVMIGRSSGFVSASTGGGDVRVGPVAGSVKATTGAGTVHVWISEAEGVEQLVDVMAGVGEVVLDLPPGLSARFELESGYTKSFGRRTRIESDWSLVQSETTFWDDSRGQTPRRYVRARGEAGRGGPLIRVRTTNGNITVRRRAP